MQARGRTRVRELDGWHNQHGHAVVVAQVACTETEKKNGDDEHVPARPGVEVEQFIKLAAGARESLRPRLDLRKRFRKSGL